jgi:hypothetical protein
MDLHFATEKVASFKDAALRYLVIVAGILTALALNQWIESRAQARQGAVALAEIEAELQRNQTLLGKVLAQQAAQLERLTQAEALLGADSFATPGLDRRARELVQGDLLSEVGNINLAALQRSAWDTAVASQSLQYLPRGRAEAMARVYAAMLEISTMARQFTASSSNFASLLVIDAFNRGESTDALRFARALREHRLTLAGAHSGYQALAEALAQALGDVAATDAPAPTAAASAASAASTAR